ncbi:hypothetical protein ABT282_07185 [Streptomyces sp. NPDC000927]|uniref:hypothetical protein n=1 Tax=Streptomyces sp. NPDC000927 TaxID=3154371 RepID=UPI00331F6266
MAEVKIVAELDMTAPESGILLVTGAAWPESPQALLGRDGRNWYLDDPYEDPIPKAYYGTDRTRELVVRGYMMGHLGLKPGEFRLVINREW